MKATAAKSDFHKAPKAWSQIKHRILGNYLSLFLGKLGLTGRPMYYVDGFAGPGRLEDGTEGSPLVAAKLAAEPRQKSERACCPASTSKRCPPPLRTWSRRQRLT
jgi:hypothetical protein